MKTTELGKYLRKLRIDHGEVMKEMADKLGITTSYLSAIELGKRTPQEDLIEKVAGQYELPSDQKRRLLFAMTASLSEIKLNLENASQADRSLALCFARSLPQMGADKKEELKKLLGVPDGE